MERCLAVRRQVHSGSRKVCTKLVSDLLLNEVWTLPWPLVRLHRNLFMERRLDCEGHPLEEIYLVISTHQVVRRGDLPQESSPGLAVEYTGGLS